MFDLQPDPYSFMHVFNHRVFLHGAVGNMFLAIDEPSTRNSNSDLSSIVYKEMTVSSDSNVKQETTSGPAGEDEIRMEVKKEVERINKHSKPTKPIEGKAQIIADAKKADIIRQEIMNLKEIESQKANNNEQQFLEQDQTTVIENEVNEENEAAKDFEASVQSYESAEEHINDGEALHESLIDAKEQKTIDDEKEDDVSVDERETGAEYETETSPIEDEADSGIAVEDYLKQLQAEKYDVPVEEYIRRMTSIASVQDSKVEVSYVEGEEVKVQEVGKDEAKEVEDKAREEFNDDIEDSEEESECEVEEKQAETPGGMIPAKQQRMLIDAVLSLDYPSESDSDADDVDEICHYATIERPSTPNNDLSNEEGDKRKEESHLDVIINAPPGFENPAEEKHQSQSKIREHNVQYGATAEDRPVVHHVYVKVGKMEKAPPLESDAKQDENEATVEDETRTTDVCEDEPEVKEEACIESVVEDKKLEIAESDFEQDVDGKQARILN